MQKYALQWWWVIYVINIEVAYVNNELNDLERPFSPKKRPFLAQRCLKLIQIVALQFSRQNEFFPEFSCQKWFFKTLLWLKALEVQQKKEKYCFASSFVVFWGRAGAVRPLIERTQTSSSVTSQICFCLKATFLGRPNSPSKQWWCTKRCLTSVLLLLQRLLLLYSRAVQHTSKVFLLTFQLLQNQ